MGIVIGSSGRSLDRRAGEGPSGGGYTAEPIGKLRFVFAVAPPHPLAKATKPLGKAELHEHRAIAIGDSGRQLPTRTVGLLFGQDSLAVSDMRTKYEFQVAGLGFVFFARSLCTGGD